MSKFFKALEQAERDNAQPDAPTPEAPADEAAAEATAETESERPPVIARWPAPDKEHPPVFTPPNPRAGHQLIDPPRPPVDALPRATVETLRPPVETPRPPVETPPPAAEPPRPVVEMPRPMVESPRPTVESPRPAVEPPRRVVEPLRPASPPRPAAPPRPVVEFSRPVDKSRIAPALLDEHLVSLQAPSTAAAEQYRVLRHLVETLRRRANLQVIGVTSPAGGDGKSVTAINLAGALSQSDDARVLLVDMDLRRPAIARYLHIEQARPTLADALGTPGLALKDSVIHISRFNLAVLQAPVSAAAPYELLRSPRLETLLAEARQQYDYVVVDSPPFVPYPDCRLISKSIDGFVMVVASNRTPRGVLAEALKALDPEKAIGYVFNAHPSRPAPELEEANGRSVPWRRKGESA
jgi:capsular exopolysaccharide synthesis family protein